MQEASFVGGELVFSLLFAGSLGISQAMSFVVTGQWGANTESDVNRQQGSLTVPFFLFVSQQPS